MPFHEQTRNPSVAVRQQDQCPPARGGWEKVMLYLIWPCWCITRLIRWLTGASPPDHPMPESRSTWETWACSMENLPGEVPIAWIPLRTNRYHSARLRDQGMARESHSQPLGSPRARSFDFSILGCVENGYFIPPITHSDDDAPIPSCSHMLGTQVYPSPGEATRLTADTVRWPFLSSSESDEEPDDESNMEMEAVTSIAKLPGFLLPSSSELNDNSDEELHGGIRTVASMAMVFKNPRRALPIATGGFCEALQPHTSLASPPPIEDFSSDPDSPLNAPSLAFGVASITETAEDGCEGEDEREEETSTAARSVLLSPVGRPTLIQLPARPQVSP
ncbi:hypothetical protein FGADI_5492 [Fusarium gaditjirri]|uniref:Uncharacterized protein n=1 Tax=Fusarium gaditjirri TaxID=282569 RepID=A0A8H4WY67_9HYPO|nr:hypothetical protein FGADI_5492 [Fusarium gaditjirri]